MKNIKKFGQFVTEELSPDVLKRASDLAKEKGQNSLSKRFTNHSRSIQWEEKNKSLTKYKFNLIRFWEQDSSREEEHGDWDVNFKLNDPERFAMDYKFSGHDWTDTNEFNIHFGQKLPDDHHKTTIVIMNLSDDKTLELYKDYQGGAAWFKDRMSANNFVKLFKDLYSMGYMDKWFEEQDVLDIDEVKFDIRKYYGE